MKFIFIYLFIIFFGGTWRLGHPTCVLESDFGFVLNCAFKKSGLFRVRNLGGIKAHVGLGLSLGDELGFKESLSNVEASRRRSVQGSSNLQALLAQKGVAPMRSQVPSTYPKSSETSSNVPPFKPIPPAPERPLQLNTTRRLNSNIATPALKGTFPMFNSISPTRLTPTSTGDVGKSGAVAIVVPIANRRKVDTLNSNNFALRTLASQTNEISPGIPPSGAANTIQLLSTATNLSTDAIEAALFKHQQKKLITTTPQPNNPTVPPLRQFGASANNKVMNAPREYYPVGYDKNYDDNFVSRVDLPETSFYCGDQKHFPGLYADEDLGCMVFHVCALTDDGLIMKSFLCPESTLFDQSILKCNWWFYVECKNSKKLYDSNIPVSKSYQLMKALTFFSSYKNETPTQKSKSKD